MRAGNSVAPTNASGVVSWLHSSHLHRGIGASSSDGNGLPINTSLSSFVSTFDMHQLLKYVCESVFVGHDEWAYAQRSERWKLGSHILRFFQLVLVTPSAPPSLSSSQQQAPPSSLHSISLQQYLYTLFLTEPSMLLSLLRPLLLGLSLLDRLNFDRAHEGEIGLLQDLLAHTFLVLQRLMELEGQRAAVAVGAASNKPTSFYTVLLESVAAAQAPPSWRYVNRRRGGRFAATTPPSLLHAITEFANYTRSVELQGLAIQTLRLLCAGSNVAGGSQANGATAAAPNNLVAHFQPRTLLLYRRTCLQLLSAHSTELTLRIELLQLLATMFEQQPLLAHCFVSNSGALTGQSGDEEDEEEEEEGDGLFELLQAYLTAAEDQLRGDLQALWLICRIVCAVWQAALVPSSVASNDFLTMQQRLCKDVAGFWKQITLCLTADMPDIQVSTHTYTHTHTVTFLVLFLLLPVPRCFRLLALSARPLLLPGPLQRDFRAKNVHGKGIVAPDR
jgi:hypothetical protein